MTIQDIIKQLQKDPQVAKKYNEKYLHSVLEEQLFLLDYKKTFEKELKENSIDEEEIELDPEEIPIEEPKDIVIPEEEPEINSPEQELDDKPALETEPKDEPEPEIQQRPEDDNGEVELEPDQLPAPTKDIPLQNQDKISTKEAEADGYIRISPQDARELLSYKGKMFTAIFIKRSDGSLRSLNGMTGVRKYTVGGELPYSPKEKELIPVYDLKLGPGRQGYRTIPLEGLKALKINGKKYKIDQALVKEIKINNPSIVYNDNRTKNYKPFERGRNVNQTIINLLILNPYLTEKQILEILVDIEGLYSSYKVVQDKLRSTPNLDRKIIKNPKTRRNIYIYFIKKNIQEIIINNPIKTWDDILNLIADDNKNIIRKNIRKYARELGWKENGETVSTYIQNNPKLIPLYYNKLKQLEQENMKKIALKELIKEVLLEVKASKKVIEENGVPQRSPQRQTPDREVIEKPETDTPERKPKRRTLTPPTESPDTKPKAEGVEKELAGKMASRFSKLKQGTLNEGPTKDRAIKIILGKSDKYTKEELSSKSDQELAKIIQGLIKGA